MLRYVFISLPYEMTSAIHVYLHKPHNQCARYDKHDLPNSPSSHALSALDANPPGNLRGFRLSPRSR
jgi:hypothetical protein